MITTPTGVPITTCDECGHEHPVTRRHCRECTRASLFITPSGLCLTCQAETDRAALEAEADQ